MSIPFKPGKEVEWIELNMLCYGKPLSKASLITLSGEEKEEEVDEWLTELDHRITAMGSSQAPYRITNGRVVATKSWKDVPEYFLCAHYSYRGAGDATNGTKLFERISGRAMEHFLSGQHIALGFPSSKSFNAQLDEIARVSREPRHLVADGKYKDDRVDVFAYKLFGDNRPANLYILMQCAAGIHWRNKRDINLERWTNYIQWYQKQIILSMATTDVIENDEWNHQASEYGLLFDRLRIYRCLYGSGHVDLGLRKDVLEWCKKHSVVAA